MPVCACAFVCVCVSALQSVEVGCVAVSRFDGSVRVCMCVYARVLHAHLHQYPHSYPCPTLPDPHQGGKRGWEGVGGASSVLQYAAMCCSVLQAAACCRVSQCGEEGGG